METTASRPIGLPADQPARPCQNWPTGQPADQSAKSLTYEC